MPRDRFTELPACVLELSHLTELRVSNNAIKALPAQIRMLQQLVVLAVDANKLTELPATVAELPALTTLNARQNSIKALPDLAGLGRLKILALSSNALAAPPPGLASLASLEELYLNGNRCVRRSTGAFPGRRCPLRFCYLHARSVTVSAGLSNSRSPPWASARSWS